MTNVKKGDFIVKKEQIVLKKWLLIKNHENNNQLEPIVSRLKTVINDIEESQFSEDITYRKRYNKMKKFFVSEQQFFNMSDEEILNTVKNFTDHKYRQINDHLDEILTYGLSYEMFQRVEAFCFELEYKLKHADEAIKYGCFDPNYKHHTSPRAYATATQIKKHF